MCRKVKLKLLPLAGNGKKSLSLCPKFPFVATFSNAGHPKRAVLFDTHFCVVND